jgi:hypothetical protein
MGAERRPKGDLKGRDDHIYTTVTAKIFVPAVSITLLVRALSQWSFKKWLSADAPDKL